MTCPVVRYTLAIAILWLPQLASAQAKFDLDNGMKVLAVQRPGSDICGVNLAFDIGPERVWPHKAGLRALAQHVLLSSIRERVGESDQWRALRLQGSQGASFTVNTDTDYVEFIASITKQQLPQLLKLMAVGVFEAQWSPEDLQTARERLRQLRHELTRPDAGPHGQAFQTMKKAMWGGTAASYSIFGTAETDANITPTDVKTYYRAYYVPNLASICIVSPEPPEQALQLVKDAFGGYEASRSRQTLQPKSDVPTQLKHNNVEVDLSPATHSALVAVGIPMPSARSEAYMTAQILHSALSGPNGGLATSDELAELIPALPNVVGLGEGPARVLAVVTAEKPYMSILVRTAPTRVEEARRAILALLSKYMQQKMTGAELTRAKTRAITLHARSLSSAEDAAALFNHHLLLTGQIMSHERFIQFVGQTTAADIQKFAKRQFPKYSIGVIMPGI